MVPSDALAAKAVLDVIHARRSVRRFTDEPVPDEVIRTLVDAARMAPSGGNRQMWRFRAIRDRQLLSAMGEAVERRVKEIRARVSSPRALEQYDGYTAHFTHFAKAPAVIAVLAKPYDSIYTRILERYLKPEERPPQHLVDVAAMSVAAAIENMLLAACALGYGGCFMTGPLIAQGELEALLHVEEPWHLVALVPVGKPAGEAPPRERIGLDEILSIE